MMRIKKKDKDRDPEYDWILERYGGYTDYNSDLIYSMKQSVNTKTITIDNWNYMVHIINKYKLINIMKEFIGTANIFYKVYEYNNKVKK